MSLSPARTVALKALGEIRRRAAYSRPIVDGVVGRSALSAQDAALATRLVYTAIAAQGVLDDVINEFAKRPGAVEPAVRDALRLSIGEILYLRTPSRAAVHQGVDAVRGVRPAASGFANAVLRKVAERAEQFPWGDAATDNAALGRLSGMPEWLVERFLTDLGQDAGREALLACMEPAPLFVRVNPFVADRTHALEILERDGAAPEDSPPDADTIKCGNARAAVRGQAIRDGAVIVSDACAQVAPLACAAGPGMRVLDIAAGHGTKTAMIQGVALRNGGPASVTAVDLHAFKLQELETALSALRVPAANVLELDASQASILSEAGSGYDVALVDAPCSGLGTLRRHPEKRWRIAPEDVERLANLQLAMLEAAAHVVRPGGVVVYSTCTITRTENEDVVNAFLGGEMGALFSTRPIGSFVNASWERFITPEGWFRSWPERGGADGHFVAKLVRSDV